MEKLKSMKKRKPLRSAGGKAVATPRVKPVAVARATLDASASASPGATPAATASPDATASTIASPDASAVQVAAVEASAVQVAAVEASAVQVAAVEASAVQVAAVEASVSPLIHLEPSLEIKDVENAHRQLVAALDRGTAVTVDVSRIRAVDTAGVQLLVAFQSEAAKRGASVEFCGESASLTHALTVLGLGTVVRFATVHG